MHGSRIKAESWIHLSIHMDKLIYTHDGYVNLRFKIDYETQLSRITHIQVNNEAFVLPRAWASIREHMLLLSSHYITDGIQVDN